MRKLSDKMKLLAPIQHIGYSLAYLVGVGLFNVLNHVQVEREAKLDFNTNSGILVVSNHKTLIDNWLLTYAVFGHRIIVKPRLAPYHPAAVENYLDTKIKRLIFGGFLKCIPVDRHKFDLELLNHMSEILCEGNSMITFPEGTRSRTGRVSDRARIGVGHIIYHSKPCVIPVYHMGTEQVLPVGAKFAKLRKRILVKIGKPLALDKFYKMPDETQTWEQVALYALNAIKSLESKVNE